MKPGKMISMLSMQDQDFYQLDYKDLKYLRKRIKKSKDFGSKSVRMFKKHGLDSDLELPGENFSRVAWRTDILESNKKKKGKKDDEAESLSEDEDDDDDDEGEGAPAATKKAATGTVASGDTKAAAGGAAKK